MLRSFSPDRILRFILNGGLDEPDPISAETSPLLLIESALALAPGIGFGPLVGINPQKLVSTHIRPVLVCENLTDLDNANVQECAGIITLYGDVTSHLVLRATAFAIPVIRVSREQMDVIHSLPNRSLVTVVSGRGRASVIRGEMVLSAKLDSDLQCEMALAARRFRTIEVRANIDNHTDAENAKLLGADGIGMWRTENFLLSHIQERHLFSLLLRSNTVQQDKRLDGFVAAIESELLLILKQSLPKPVVVRLFDKPLHDLLSPHSKLRSRSRNPLLSIRGARLGIIYPTLAICQTRAICNVIHKLHAEGANSKLHILVPFVTHASEVLWYRSLFRKVWSQSFCGNLVMKLGANIETPRAAIAARTIARVSDFFSFGTNDLTQYTWALDRDFASAEIIDCYQKEDVLHENPFSEFDECGVGALLEHAINEARDENPEIIFGVTGHFAADTTLTDYFQGLRLHYLSVPLATIPRVALALSVTALRQEVTSRHGETDKTLNGHC